MYETESNFFQDAIVKPLKNNLSSVMFWVGMLFVFVGAIFGEYIDAFKYIPKGTGEAILKGGSAILGAGVFDLPPQIRTPDYTDFCCFSKSAGLK
jgi:hypothetical protein